MKHPKGQVMILLNIAIRANDSVDGIQKILDTLVPFSPEIAKIHVVSADTYDRVKHKLGEDCDDF